MLGIGFACQEFAKHFWIANGGHRFLFVKPFPVWALNSALRHRPVGVMFEVNSTILNVSSVMMLLKIDSLMPAIATICDYIEQGAWSLRPRSWWKLERRSEPSRYDQALCFDWVRCWPVKRRELTYGLFFPRLMRVKGARLLSDKGVGLLYHNSLLLWLYWKSLRRNFIASFVPVNSFRVISHLP